MRAWRSGIGRFFLVKLTRGLVLATSFFAQSSCGRRDHLQPLIFLFVFLETALEHFCADSKLARSYVLSCLLTSVMPREGLLQAERMDISCSFE